MPHAASDAGMGCLFSQPPLAYWKKSTAGLTVVSRFAARKSLRVGAFAVVTGWLHDANTVTAATMAIGREKSRAARPETRSGANAEGDIEFLSAGYLLSQYESFTRNVLAGWRRKRSRMSPLNVWSPSMLLNPWRPWFHTTNSVEPGLYSQRNTTLDCSALKLKPPGFVVTDGSL